jgi:hypothetical protein
MYPQRLTMMLTTAKGNVKQQQYIRLHRDGSAIDDVTTLKLRW